MMDKVKNPSNPWILLFTILQQKYLSKIYYNKKSSEPYIIYCQHHFHLKRSCGNHAAITDDGKLERGRVEQPHIKFEKNPPIV
jgi:hypothetical protein